MPAAILNPDATIRFERQGLEQQPVIVIDDMLADLPKWRGLAEAADYGTMGAHYPGIRSPVPYRVATRMRDELAALISDTFALDPVPPVLECFFSIVTTPPSALAPIQRLPHVDGLEPNRLAILIYLSGAEQGGTAFYRQRETGFETIDAARHPAFKAALERGIAAHGLPDPAYIAGDTPLYEQVAVHHARPNRALIYRSHLLHCAHIPADIPLPADPVTGRLSINSFLFG
ncbi:hypothetical protein GGQ80_000345 [Sphingomonas jinjuensis]|uniref:Uncharacterized protein n=1 Tax=Sphingomonas jinjuensis TaxID=535907 RepID=A0A840F3T4_9SPHN|nr:DUF6445 family protein [Sphingomonas jinjuensis]MBB4152469.1 hypothetical protein [Sphingomonas jinjuensis]